MVAPFRLHPEKAFPPYVFIPGVNPHPKKEGGYRQQIPEPVSPKVDLQNPQASDDLKYALDLFNYGYFWESHVYFEALWNAHSRIGTVADFFKGMIKLGAAGVKASIDQGVNAQDHQDRAEELFTGVLEKEGPLFLGFNLKQIIQDISERKKLFITFD